jgi:outer membrane lipoprotein-sorting protein
MTKNTIRSILAFIVSFLLSHTTSSQTARDIVAKAENLIRGTSSHGTFEMTVETPDFTRSLTMESWWVEKTPSEADRSLIVIRAPNKEEGNKWLKVGNEMWNYLRATETVIKIPPSMMLQSWNGSDFTNDDLARESSLSRDYIPELAGEEEIAGEPCWKLILRPEPEAPVVWGKLYIWVRKADMLPATVQYFDEKGTLVRTMTYSDVRSMGGRTIPTTWTMVNHAREGHRTVFRIVDIEFDRPIPGRIFSFRELERRE